MIGKRPDAVFVSFTGKPRTQEAIKVAIERTVLRHLGVKMTPHQFHHLAAKIELDGSPGAYEYLQEHVRVGDALGALAGMLLAPALLLAFGVDFRIQTDRGQHVVTTGPYAFVRLYFRVLQEGEVGAGPSSP